MKVFFASFTDPSVEVDAYVDDAAQGIRILDALRRMYRSDSIVMRVRVKRFCMYERRYIGIASKATKFIKQLEEELFSHG